jgi:PPOX class probable F420-dependent enzyme
MQLSDAVRRFLQEKRFAVLATIGRDGIPQQTVMWYELRGDLIVMNTAAGRAKDIYLRRDPRASICVEDRYNFVTISGTIQMVEEQATAQEDIYRLAVRYNGEDAAARQVRESFSKQQRITLLLPIERLIIRGFDE